MPKAWATPNDLLFQYTKSLDGEHQVKQFRDSDRIASPNFPELNLTAQQILAAGF